jgi:hypothetical protein
MENSVVFDEQVMEIVKTFLAEEKVDNLPDEERTPNKLWASCADFVKREMLNRVDEPRYWKRMLKAASRSSLGDSGICLVDIPELLDNVLSHFSLQEAGRLGCTCKELARIVRDDTRTWKPNGLARKFEFCMDECSSDDVYGMLSFAYPYYRHNALSEFAVWLVREVFRRRDFRDEDLWEAFLGCVPHEKRRKEDGEEGEQEIWVLTPSTHSQIIARNMDELNRILEKQCLEVVSPPCWQNWDTSDPKWCERVKTAFGEWREKLPFEIDENRINGQSILARISEETFESVKSKIDSKIGKFRNWNHFAYTLLRRCHNEYRMPDDEEYNDDYGVVSYDFERDAGDDYEEPDDADSASSEDEGLSDEDD